MERIRGECKPAFQIHEPATPYGVRYCGDEPPPLSQERVAVTQMEQLGSYAEMMLVHENAVLKVDNDVHFNRLRGDDGTGGSREAASR